MSALLLRWEAWPAPPPEIQDAKYAAFGVLPTGEDRQLPTINLLVVISQLGLELAAVHVVLHARDDVVPYILAALVHNGHIDTIQSAAPVHGPADSINSGAAAGRLLQHRLADSRAMLLNLSCQLCFARSMRISLRNHMLIGAEVDAVQQKLVEVHRASLESQAVSGRWQSISLGNTPNPSCHGTIKLTQSNTAEDLAVHVPRSGSSAKRRPVHRIIARDRDELISSSSTVASLPVETDALLCSHQILCNNPLLCGYALTLDTLPLAE